MADSKLHDLLDAIKAEVETVTGLAASNVIVGEIYNLDSRPEADFPCVEIFMLAQTGGGYYEQRKITEEEKFRICLHQYKSTPDRDTGNDMTSLIDLTNDIRVKLFSFHDDASPPCDGFLDVKGEYDIQYFYELVSDNINTSITTFSIRLDTADTEV